MDKIIRTENIGKSYGRFKAVSNLTLNVRKGEIYGFLGLNGAGKTTSIRMLLGMIQPTSGAAFINNEKVNPAKTKLWQKIGYMVETPYSYPGLTVRQNLEIIRKLRSLPEKSSIDEIMEKLRISQYAQRKARHLSSGNSQRLGLAKALMHKPEILILDEPTSSLDPAGIHEIREMLIDLATNQGVTIFISSHILSEISKFATRIGIIHEGVLLQEINTCDLSTLCNKEVLLETVNNSSAEEILKSKNISFRVNDEKQIFVTEEKYIRNPEILSAMLSENNLPPRCIHVQGEDLETYFLRLINSQGGKK